MKPKRDRKVYYAFYLTEGDATEYPVIRIAGKFLESLGFRIGEAIQVEYEPSRITITKREEKVR